MGSNAAETIQGVKDCLWAERRTGYRNVSGSVQGGLFTLRIYQTLIEFGMFVSR